MIPLLCLFGYFVAAVIHVYIKRRLNPYRWEYYGYEIIWGGAFWPVTTFINLVRCFFVKGIGGLYEKIDKILDEPPKIKTPKIKIPKFDNRIIGYSLNEVDIEFPTLDAARRANHGYAVFRHYIDSHYDMVPTDTETLQKYKKSHEDTKSEEYESRCAERKMYG